MITDNNYYIPLYSTYTSFTNQPNYITTTTSNNYTISYMPFSSNYIYDDELVPYFTDDMEGFASYIFAQCSRGYINDVLEDMSNDYELQYFQDNLYRIVLDILYEISKETIYFPSFFDEKKFNYQKMNKFIQSIINDFNEKFLVEEL